MEEGQYWSLTNTTGGLRAWMRGCEKISKFFLKSVRELSVAAVTMLYCPKSVSFHVYTFQ
jgi:hypothetical protein